MGYGTLLLGTHEMQAKPAYQVALVLNSHKKKLLLCLKNLKLGEKNHFKP